MRQLYYSYRLQDRVALLDEAEWAIIEPLVNNRERLKALKVLRKTTGCTIEEALETEPIGLKALAAYKSLTGRTIQNPEALYHVRAQRYGAPCPSCGKPFRTPRAKMCAECGHWLPPGHVTGPLEM